MHDFDPLHQTKFDPSKNIEEDNINLINLQYINKLYTIELLRYVNVNNVDIQVAWQYGQEFLTPWKDDKYLVKNFLEHNRYNLRKYIAYKAMAAVQKLLNGLEDFCTDLYVKVPMDAATRTSILSAMNNMNNVTQFKSRLLDEYLMELRGGVTSTVRYGHGNFSEFEICDRIMCALFNTYTEMYKDLDTCKAKHHYGVHRKELLDNRFYMCKKLLKEMSDIQFCEMKKDNFYHNFGAWACLFSMLYRLVIPTEMHPNRLERMYEKYILRIPQAELGLSFARNFSDMCVEAVIGDKLPMLNKKFEFDTELNKEYSSYGIYPDSLVEHYLVTEKVLQPYNITK